MGVGIFLTDIFSNKILLGKRKDTGLYGLPGGWLEKFEDWNECASRELKEETNLDFPKERFNYMSTLNCFRIEKNYHAISLIMYSEIKEKEKTEVKNMEPNKCEKWLWVTITQMRSAIKSLFYPLQDFLKQHPKMDSVIYLRKLAGFSFKMEVEEEVSEKKMSIDSTLNKEINKHLDCTSSTDDDSTTWKVAKGTHKYRFRKSKEINELCELDDILQELEFNMKEIKEENKKGEGGDGEVFI